MAGKVLSDGSAQLPPNAELRQMLTTKTVRLSDGSTRQLSSASSIEECCCMYNFLRQSKPKCVIEIGMAYGASALTILTALGENGDGRLVSIDPYPQFDSARLSALGAIQRSKLEHLHTHVHGVSQMELPILVKSEMLADFIYIDGDHSYEGALIDMYFCDRLLSPGGVLAFDDSGWMSVHRVIRHMLKTRPYTEIDVGLRRNYRGRNVVGSALRRLQGRFGSSRYFQKSGVN